MSWLSKIKKNIKKKSGKVERGVIFIIVIITSLMFVGFLFVGGTFPTKLPELKKNETFVQLLPVTPGPAQNSLQLHALFGVTTTPYPTQPPNAPLPTATVPLVGGQCVPLKGKENPNMIWSLGIAATKGSGNEQALIVYYTAAHPMILGTGNVTAMKQFPADHAVNPNVGNLNQKDIDGFPYSPAVFISDISANPNEQSGDAQNGGVPQNPSDVYGAWKALGGFNPATPNFPLLSGGDDQPWPPANGPGGGARDTTWGSEVIWKLAHLKTKDGQALQPGRNYRAQIVLHDGEGTSNVAQVCTNFTMPGNSNNNTSPPTASSDLTNCEQNPGRCGYPDKANTGIPAGTSLTILNGNQKFSTPNQVIEGKDIRGCVEVSAPGVTIRNSKITCNGYFGILTTNAAAKKSAARLTIENVEMVNGGNTTGIAFTNFTARRVYSHGGENGFDTSSDATVEDSFITGIVEVNGGHGDGIQVSAPAANILIQRNTIFAHGTTAAVNWTEQTSSVVVKDNLLAGGAYVLYCPRVTVPNGAFQTINNRFGTFTYGYTSYCGKNGQIFTGNYKDSDLKPIQAN